MQPGWYQQGQLAISVLQINPASSFIRMTFSWRCWIVAHDDGADADGVDAVSSMGGMVKS